MAFPTTNLIARHEARLESGPPADGTAMSTIADQSGNSNVLTATTTARATFKTGIVNGEPVYRFNGTTNTYDTAFASAPSGSFSAAVFVKSDSESATRRWVYGPHTATTDIWAFTEGETASEWGIFARRSGVTRQIYTSGVDTTEWTLLVMVRDATTDGIAFYRNGSLVGSDTLGSGSAPSTMSMSAGVTAQFFDGDIALGAIWNDALDSTERADLWDYVQTTYLPSGQTVAVGQATEAETPQAITPIKPQTVAVGPVTEAEIAQAITPVKPQFVAVGQATEAELGLTVTPIKHIIVPVGQATEAEIAQAITALKHIIVNVGTATEAELAQAITPFGPSAIYLATATGTILGPTAVGSIRTPTAVGTVL